MSGRNPIKDYGRLSRALSGQGEPRESKIERQNRENRERNLKREAELRQAREAARIADKMGEKAGVSKPVRDAYTKPFRK
jgi:predicted nucleic acid-binding Zn ribbon protein